MRLTSLPDALRPCPRRPPHQRRPTPRRHVGSRDHPMPKPICSPGQYPRLSGSQHQPRWPLHGLHSPSLRPQGSTPVPLLFLFLILSCPRTRSLDAARCARARSLLVLGPYEAPTRAPTLDSDTRLWQGGAVDALVSEGACHWNSRPVAPVGLAAAGCGEEVGREACGQDGGVGSEWQRGV